RCIARSSVFVATPDSSAAWRSFWSSSMPTPTISAVFAILSASAMVRLTPTAIPAAAAAIAVPAIRAARWAAAANRCRLKFARFSPLSNSALFALRLTRSAPMTDCAIHESPGRSRMRLLLTAALVLAALPATAQDSVVVEACKRVGAHLYTKDSIDVSVAQDFSELTPPRARLRLNDLFATKLTCKFRSSERPVQLIELCHDDFCRKAGDERFDEVRFLLEQEGY